MWSTCSICHQRLKRPILVIARRAPDLGAIHSALAQRLEGGRTKWRMIEAAGAMEPVGDVFIQRVGLTRDQAVATLSQWSIHSRIPEPLRCAHLIAGALVTGQSRKRP